MVKKTVEKFVETVKVVTTTKKDPLVLELEQLRKQNQRQYLPNGRRVSEQIAYIEGVLDGRK